MCGGVGGWVGGGGGGGVVGGGGGDKQEHRTRVLGVFHTHLFTNEKPTCQQACSRVSNCGASPLARGQLQSGDVDVVHLKLPVSLTRHGNPGDSTA